MKRLLVIGHRGCGKNKINATSGDSLHSIMENTITSFNTAASHGADFVEFDVQVTEDGCPVLFHDNHVVAKVEGRIVAKKISDITLQEFLAIGSQNDQSKTDKVLLREAADGTLVPWTVSVNDSFCTLEEAFEQVSSLVGFNIELKFADQNIAGAIMQQTVDTVLEVISRCSKNRSIILSSFHPDAVEVMRADQSTYPVYFLTEGGLHLHEDSRRNSLEAAVDVCRKAALDGIVAEAASILLRPQAVKSILEADLALLTYGEVNDDADAVRRQEALGVEGVIVDEVPKAVSEIKMSPSASCEADKSEVMNSSSNSSIIAMAASTAARGTITTQLVRAVPA